MKGRPWFTTPGKPGDRTLEQQLMGLDPLWAEIEGKSVLDVGCAEGLISIECAKRGAGVVHGFEIRPEAVWIAQAHAKRLTYDNGVYRPRPEAECIFKVGDANLWTPALRYDIVLLLAVLHKLKNPFKACQRLAKAAKDLVVIRLPPEHAPFVVDPRSGNQPHNIRSAMTDEGFKLEHHNNDGPFGEWMGYYRRIK